MNALSKSDLGNTMDDKLRAIRGNREKLIENTQAIKLNIFNRKEYLKDEPSYISGFKKGDTIEKNDQWPNKSKDTINTYLNREFKELMSEKLKYQQRLRKSKNDFKKWENKQINSLK